jgi:hypothetical protein
MLEFTEEQELEVQRRMGEAARYEQWRVAFAQAFRLTLPYLEGLSDQVDPQTNKIIKRGAVSPFVVEVFREECNQIIVRLFPPTQPQSPGPAEKEKPDD